MELSWEKFPWESDFHGNSRFMHISGITIQRCHGVGDCMLQRRKARCILWCLSDDCKLQQMDDEVVPGTVSVKLVLKFAQLFIVCVVGIFFILYQCFVVKTPLMSHPLNCPADHVHLSSRRPCYGRAGPLLNSTTAGSFQVSEWK